MKNTKKTFLNKSVNFLCLLNVLLLLFIPNTLKASDCWSDTEVFASAEQIGAIKLGLDNNGNAVAVWLETDGANLVVMGSTLPFNGSWTTPVQLSVGGQEARVPQIAVAANGNAVAVWTRFNGANWIIQSASLPFGGSWSAPVNLSVAGQDAFDPTNSTTQIDTSPDVAVNAEGDAVAVWTRMDGANWIVQSSTLTFGGTWTSPKNLSAAGEDAFQPHVSVDAEGNAVAIWRRFNGSEFIVQVSTLAAGDDEWSMVVDLSATGQDAFDPQIALDCTGNGVAIWRRDDGTGDLIIQASTLLFGGWLAPVDLSAAGEDAFEPNVDLNKSGYAVATWRRFNGANTIVQASTLFLGENWSAPVDLSPLGITAFSPLVAVDCVGNAIITWRNDVPPDRVVFASSLPFGSTTWSTPVQLSASDNVAVGVDLDIDCCGNAVAAWAITDRPMEELEYSTCINEFPPFPPENLQITQCKDSFAVQVDCINLLCWEASPCPNVVEYKIFRNGQLIGTVSASDPLKFEDHNRIKGKSDTYEIIAVNGEGLESEPLTLTFPEKEEEE